MAQFKVGDWVTIQTTAYDKRPLCVLGKVLEVGLNHPYSNGTFHIDTIWKYDPTGIDDNHTGYWPDNHDFLHIERCGPPDGAV